jgi:hypothetical protein
MNICEYCNEPINGNYCSNCGQPAILKRIDKRYVFHEIGEILGANKGLLFTIKKLLISPGKSIQHFLTKDRYRFVKPIIFVITTSLIYTLVNYFFQIEVNDHTFVSPFFDIKVEGIDGIDSFFRWMKDNFGYSNLFIGLFMAFWIKIFFRKLGYNLFEIFVLLCFVSGISTLILSVGTILHSITHLNITKIANYIAMIYSVWAVGQFFDKKKAASYTKALLAYILGGITFATLIISVGMLINIIMK